MSPPPDVRHLPGSSGDVPEAQFAKLKSLFPECVSEGRVDFDKLKATLGADAGRFAFSWAGNDDALTLLFEPYFVREKRIYIDPPYHTGNDFVYPDNFADPLKKSLIRAGRFVVPTGNRLIHRFHGLHGVIKKERDEKTGTGTGLRPEQNRRPRGLRGSICGIR